MLDSMDISKSKTALEKEIEEQIKENRRNMGLPEELPGEFTEAELAAKKQLEDEAAARAREEEEEREEEEVRPTGIVQPKYKVVLSFPADMQEAWDGHKGAIEEALLQKKQKLPTELTVTIYAKFIDNMKKAKLDVNESTLLFEYPGLYYLDLNLKYLCDPSRGNAKFDKSKHTLTIRVPVVGLTEDSQKVIDKNFEEFMLEQQKHRERLKELEKTKLDDPELARKARKG